ncbi:MAG: hypothetical protein DYH13_00280 [Alphaproteobacteria bacterium PRO2]|nr:hypothetical protein [Alphaproteobacteria bacterium PRO2]
MAFFPPSFQRKLESMDRTAQNLIIELTDGWIPAVVYPREGGGRDAVKRKNPGPFKPRAI